MSKKATLIPAVKGFYAWNSLHAGSFLVFEKALDECYKFVFLPGPSIMHLTKEDFQTCIEKKILEFVEQLPDDIFTETIELANQKTVA